MCGHLLLYRCARCGAPRHWVFINRRLDMVPNQAISTLQAMSYDISGMLFG